MIKINDTITIEDWEITESFMRSSGPGGQHVNKVSSAVELRFEAERSPNLSSFVKTRLRKIAGRKWTKRGTSISSPLAFYLGGPGASQHLAGLGIVGAVQPP